MYNVNAIYSTYQGEVNIKGIGAPVIFVRLQGCHLRCYKDTLGTLCDTPEALDKNFVKKLYSLEELLAEVQRISYEAGNIDLVCLSGGDPLYRNKEDINLLLNTLSNEGFIVSVETSGTLAISPYRHIRNVHWVLDYKTKSAGVNSPFILDNLYILDKQDIVKFVLYDEDDYLEFIKVFSEEVNPFEYYTVAVGCYWGGKLKTSKLVANLKRDGILGMVHVNMQAHKLITHADFSDVSETLIPTLL